MCLIILFESHFKLISDHFRKAIRAYLQNTFCLRNTYPNSKLDCQVLSNIFTRKKIVEEFDSPSTNYFPKTLFLS